MEGRRKHKDTKKKKKKEIIFINSEENLSDGD